MAQSILNYPEIFAVLGKFITEKKLHDVCVMEFEDGIIVAGSVVYEGRETIRRAQETFVLSRQDLEKMSGGKRGLFTR